MKSNISFDLKPIIESVQRFKSLAVTLLVVGLFGYTAYQISLITAVEPDAAYLQANEKESAVPNFKRNKATIDEIRQLKSSGDTRVDTAAGKGDPFSL